MSAPVLRVIAVLLLLTGATDFLSFDRSDLFESMNTPGIAKGPTRETPNLRHSRPSGVTPVALPDDGCLFCGVGLPVAPAMMYFRPLVSDFKIDYALADPAFLVDSPHPPPKTLIS